MERIILHIDMNSYFASVEQQARPQLIGRPVGVVGSANKRTIIVAASVEAKKFSVKTGVQVHEARRLCPQITLIVADCRRYEAITRQFLEIFISKTSLVEVFSIDEAFLDLTRQVKNSQEAKSIAQQIKNEIKTKIGPNIRCSIGIAQNKFMAKLASEAKKPDGLTVVSPGQEIEFLDRFELTDACGIGLRTHAHLMKLGISSFSRLRQLPQTTLTLIFNSYGLKLYKIARGQDDEPIHPYFTRPWAKSISRSKTLPRNTFDPELIKKFILAFCQNIAAELRRKNLLCRSAGVYLRFADFTHSGATTTIKNSTNLAKNLYCQSKTILSQLKIKKPVRKIGVWAGALIQDPKQIYLLSEIEKNLTLEKTADQINKKWGKTVVGYASLAGLDFEGKTPNFGFKKEYELST